ncbi:MAG: restriction endonuclease subunit S [Pyrinomonadaceae bacterium]
MTLQTFFDNFGPLTDAPNGIPKLRELVLQLAVEGKLVSQDLDDESAPELLRKISANKESLAKANKIAKEESAHPIRKEETPFTLPDNWAWVRLSQITNAVHYGYTASANHALTEVRLLRITDIQNGRVDWPSVPGCEIDEKKLQGVKLANNDILIARTGGTIGKSFLVQNLELTAVFASYLIRALPNEKLFAPYLKVFLESQSYWTQLYEKSMGTGQPNVNATSLKSLVVPLPPLDEQKRIAAKVDELMLLCDDLEARQQARRESRLSLNSATLAPLSNAASLAPEQFEQATSRLADNFDAICESAKTVGKLRSTILQLAVQGRLIPHDPNDEPAAILLETLKSVKANSSHRKKSKKEAPLTTIVEDNTPFKLPDGWQWARFCQVATIASNLVHPEDHLDYPHVAPDNIEKFTGRLLTYRTVREDKVASSNHRFFSEQIVYSKIRPNLAKAVIVDFDGLCSADMYPISSHIYAQFLLKYMLSETFLRMAVKTDTRVAMPKINQEELNKILVPVPPLQEQKRIVTKVNQLMTLCDELEAKLRQAEADSEKLMNAAVQHVLNTPANNRESQREARWLSLQPNA